MKAKERLQYWLHGESSHDNPDKVHCPDFSCCRSDLKVDYKTRKLFYDAFVGGDQDTVKVLLQWFLSRMLATPIPMPSCVQ